jgi:DNA-binding response OmpR family regulator
MSPFPSREPGASETRRQRVLVVDDEEDVRILVCRLLAEMGYDVDSAADGREGIERLEAVRPDLLILDLMMPAVDGWGVLRYLKGKPDSPPVVILTARGDHDSFTRGIREGASAYVFKPFRFHELIATCQALLLGGSQRKDVARERRQRARRVLMAEVRVLSRDKAPIALGELVDLSAQGAHVNLGLRLTPGSYVRVAFHTPDGGSTLSLEGTVRWCEPAARGFAHGLELTDPDPLTRERLRQLLGTEPTRS